MLFTLAGLCLIQSLIANVAFAQVKYSLFSDPQVTGGTQGPTGVRGAGGQNVYVTGIYHPSPTPPPPCSLDSSGLLYVGPLSGGGASGSWTVLNYPSSSGLTVSGTALYGPDGLPSGNVRLVGSFTTCEPTPPPFNHGLLYEGPTDGSGSWQTIDYPNPPGEQVQNTIAHSTMGGLVVGNFDTDIDPGGAFVYDTGSGSWFSLRQFLPPDVHAATITAYGIWYNGGTSYTIAGGYSDPNFSGLDQHGYLVNWDTATQPPTLSGWTRYDFDNGPHTRVLISHFDCITTDNKGGYYLTGTWEGEANVGGFFAHVPQMPHRPFGDARWRDIEYPGLNVDSTTGNTVFENKVLGIFMANNHTLFQGYIADVQGHR